jgi:hypothetical protein
MRCNYADCERQPLRLSKPCFGIQIIALCADIRASDYGTRTARYLARSGLIKAQLLSPSKSSVRSTLVAG